MKYSLSIITASYQIKRRIPCRKKIIEQIKLERNLPPGDYAKPIDFIKKVLHLKDFIEQNRK